jgi:hypothetical protein
MSGNAPASRPSLFEQKVCATCHNRRLVFVKGPDARSRPLTF